MSNESFPLIFVLGGTEQFEMNVMIYRTLHNSSIDKFHDNEFLVNQISYKQLILYTYTQEKLQKILWWLFRILLT